MTLQHRNWRSRRRASKALYMAAHVQKQDLVRSHSSTAARQLNVKTHGLQLLTEQAGQHSPTLKITPATWNTVQCSMMLDISRCTVMTTAVNRVAPVCHCPGVAPPCLSGYRGVRLPITKTNTSTAWKAELSSQPVTAFRSKYWLRGPA